MVVKLNLCCKDNVVIDTKEFYFVGHFNGEIMNIYNVGMGL